VCVCVCARARACVRACVRACDTSARVSKPQACFDSCPVRWSPPTRKNRWNRSSLCSGPVDRWNRYTCRRLLLLRWHSVPPPPLVHQSHSLHVLFEPLQPLPTPFPHSAIPVPHSAFPHSPFPNSPNLNDTHAPPPPPARRRRPLPRGHPAARVSRGQGAYEARGQVCGVRVSSSCTREGQGVRCSCVMFAHRGVRCSCVSFVHAGRHAQE
jgi:hypothetical protein